MKSIHSFFTGSTLLLVFSTAMFATQTYNSGTCGTGFNNIPDAIDNATPGQLACFLNITDVGLLSNSNLLTVSLIGFQHEASGDLIATLMHFTDATQTTMYGTVVTLFSRPGKLSSDPNDFGYSAPFGAPSGGDNYDFNSTFTGDLWATAAALGAIDYIPGNSAGSTGYFTTSAFSSANNGFSTAFSGQPVAGYWVLLLTDNAPGPTVGSTGTLQQWALTVNGTVGSVPEPCTAWLLASALATCFAFRKLRNAR